MLDAKLHRCTIVDVANSSNPNLVVSNDVDDSTTSSDSDTTLGVTSDASGNASSASPTSSSGDGAPLVPVSEPPTKTLCHYGVQGEAAVPLESIELCDVDGASSSAPPLIVLFILFRFFRNFLLNLI